MENQDNYSAQGPAENLEARDSLRTMSLDPQTVAAQLDATDAVQYARAFTEAINQASQALGGTIYDFGAQQGYLAPQDNERE